MKKALLVGSSHVGAIKLGLEAVASADIDFTYIALAGLKFNKLRIKSGKLFYPKKFGQFMEEAFGIARRPRLSDYDYVLFCHGACRHALSLYSSNRRIPILSNSIVKAIIHSPGVDLFNQIYDSIDPSQIVYIGSPLLSESVFQQRYISAKPVLDSEHEISRANALAALIRRYCEESALNKNTPTYLLPPSRLLANAGFNTQDKYIRGGVRVNGIPRTEGRDGDFAIDMGHGTAEYGKEMAPVILEQLQRQ